jgi:hypothetical protein
MGGLFTTVAATGTPTAAEQVLELDPDNFSNSTTIDNPWFPLTPGTRYVYEGTSVQDGEEIEHRVEYVVTDLTKMVAGVRVRVILEMDYIDGLLEEQELSFAAQDDDGNVWRIGEYVEHYDEQGYTGGRLWYSGSPEGARAGLIMPANPQMGDPAYSQGYAPPPWNWTDRGRVYQMGETVETGAGDFDNVLVIEEWDEESEEGAFQLKFHAKGVGLVAIGWRGPDPDHEEIELVELTELDPVAMEEIRTIAMAQEERALAYSQTGSIEADAAAE